MLTGKQCRQKAIHCRHMAETLIGDSATNLEMLAGEYDNDGRVADVAAALISQSRWAPILNVCFPIMAENRAIANMS